jgi:hypothetical protein
MEKYVVVLQRKEKTTMVVLRADDYTASVKIDKGNNAKMRWGSGAMWNILNVMDYEAYQNMEDSKPF